MALSCFLGIIVTAYSVDYERKFALHLKSFTHLKLSLKSGAAPIFKLVEIGSPEPM